jgi:hypothetical protein
MISTEIMLRLQISEICRAVRWVYTSVNLNEIRPKLEY